MKQYSDYKLGKINLNKNTDIGTKVFFRRLLSHINNNQITPNFLTD